LSLFGFQWFKAPADRRIIGHRNGKGGPSLDLSLRLPAIPDPHHWSFLAVGDTGEAPFPDPTNSPLYAVAAAVAAQMRLPGGSGTAELLLHLGDVVYYAGEARLYEAYVRDPYRALTAAGDGRTFGIPFLPVPGNHDYYDLNPWVEAAIRLLKTIGWHESVSRALHRNLPLGGSGAGKAYREAFVHMNGAGPPQTLDYVPGQSTRVPHRFYRFSVGEVDFFALDSNTLDAAAESEAQEPARSHSADRLDELRPERARLGAELQARLKADDAGAGECLEEWLDTQRDVARHEKRQAMSAQDYDGPQLDWLNRSLEESLRKNPNGRRVVFLHHPLYTTTTSHCEESGVVGVRRNLVPILKDRVDLVLAGHSHALEWIRSPALPNTGLIVSGGGGVSLGKSVLDPVEQGGHDERLKKLKGSGAEECVFGGRGAGDLHHYLSVEVTPETLTVRPIGVRRDAGGHPIVTTPIGVRHVPSIPAFGGDWGAERRLAGIEIRRGLEPRALWEDDSGR
jgi:3',5'-cyclic AMP phosphodiesterase CpdA